ncbi:hypothetical protein OXX80_013800, partial [Metschnikowia pulcherrima]
MGSTYRHVISLKSLLKDPSGFEEAEIEATELSKAADTVKLSNLISLP